MLEGLNAGANSDVRSLLGAHLVASSPGTARLIEADVAVHDSLVRTAWERLGSPGRTPIVPWTQMASSSRLTAPPAGITVDLGTMVRLPDAPLDPTGWTIVGIGTDGTVSLHRRLQDGIVERAQRGWGDLVRANPVLGAGHTVRPLGADGPTTWLRPSDIEDDLASMVDEIIPRATTPYEAVAQLGDEQLVYAQGSWEELASRVGLDRLTPAPRMPADAYTAASLVDAAGPPVHQLTVVAESQPFLGTSLLAGVNGTLPAGHRSATYLAELERIGDWFGTRLGLPTWTDEGLILTTGDSNYIGNAAATSIDRVAMVRTGTQDPSLLASLRRVMERGTGDDVVDAAHAVRGAWRGVLAHEVGHLATQQLWGTGPARAIEAAREAGDLGLVARLAEHDIVEEAFSDLFGAAWSRSSDIGVRQLGRLQHGMGDLTQLRSTIRAAGLAPEAHYGTQLLTKPMLQVAKQHGWEAMADVTAGAATRLGTDMANGTIDAIDIPRAAQALRDAAGRRWGAESDLVRGLDAAWRKLHVLPGATEPLAGRAGSAAQGVAAAAEGAASLGSGSAVAAGGATVAATAPAGLSTAAKVGIAAGIVVGAVALGIGIWALTRQREQ